MSQRSDDFANLEELLGSLRDEIALPPGPDVRSSVRRRLTALQSSSSESDQQWDELDPETDDIPAKPSASGNLDADRPKSLTRQLLEMAAAIVVIVLFTGAMAFLYREQIGSGSESPGATNATPTAEPPPTIVSSGPPDDEERVDLSTNDVRIDVSEDEMLALAVERWVGDRRVMSVFDLDGNHLREFDQIPNIDVDGFPSTIVADVSPDGQPVVYQQNDGDQSDIFVMGADGDDSQQLTSTGDNYRPVWSPDGEQIAFLSNRAHGDERHRYQRGEIFVMNLDGSDVQQLSDTPYGAGQIKWSHDGSMIAFASPGFHSGHMIDDGDPPEFPFQLYVVDIESREQQELPGAAMENLAGFGPLAQPWLTDNSGVFFERSGQMYLADAEGGGIHQIDDVPAGVEGHQRSPATSPDGERVAFNWSHEDGSSMGILELDSGQVSVIGDSIGSASHRGWSPDGRYLAVAASSERPEDYPEQLSHTDLWVVSIEDGSAELVASGWTGNDVQWLVVPGDARADD